MRSSLFLILSLVSSSLLASQWTVDSAHSTVGFKVKHLMISTVNGQFTDYTATVTTDAKDKVTAMDATLQTKSIDTSNGKRDEHLRGADFFDAEKNPTITFKSKSITAGKKVKVKGDLTLHGVTKEVTLEGEFTKPIKDMQGNMRRAFTGGTKLNRKDFGLTWNKTMDGGGVVVSDEVAVNLEMELTEVKDEKAKS